MPENAEIIELQSARPRLTISRMLPYDRPLINLLLFVLTIVSTTLTWGVWYGAAVVFILTAHEMGHWLACRAHGIPSTLPFFLPLPFANPFGTLGAMIRLRGPFYDRRALFDVGAAGPLAGTVASLLMIVLGFFIKPQPVRAAWASSFVPTPQPLLQGLSLLFTGSLVGGGEVLRNPLLYAGWVGLFVTSLNLLPIGQLDGGHIFYSVAGRRALKWMLAVIAALGVLAFFYYSWALLFVLLLLFGRRHPPPLDEETPLDGRRLQLALLTAILFAVTFVPFPFVF